MKSINKELVRQWVETLRSGDYEQGIGVLRTKDDKFCCLGVLCDIAKDSVNIDWKLDESDDTYLIEDTYTVLPDSLINLSGLNSDRILIPKTNTKIQEYLEDRVDVIGDMALTDLNDCYGLSFDQIADIIEEEFLK